MRPRKPKEILAQAKTPAFLVLDITNIRYLTGINISSGVVLVTSRFCTLFTDGRYKEMAERKAYKEVRVRDLADFPPALRKVRTCGFESETVTVAQFSKWKRKYKNTKFVQTKGVIEEFRRSKEPDELRYFRRAQRITREIMRRLPVILKRSITELEVSWKMEEWARELGADGLSFDPIVAFGTHTSSPHHHPANSRLKKGQMVQIDVGARFKGYCADQSAVFFTKKQTVMQKRVYETLLEAKDAAIAAVSSGVTTHKLDSIARDILEREGIEKYFCHSLGHGVGLDIHEGPTLSQKTPAQKLLKNEIVTIEPGVYLPGKWGMRVEEEVVV